MGVSSEELATKFMGLADELCSAAGSKIYVSFETKNNKFEGAFFICYVTKATNVISIENDKDLVISLSLAGITDISLEVDGIEREYTVVCDGLKWTFAFV